MKSKWYNNESKVLQILGGSIASAVVASVSILARVYSRLFLVRSFAAGDIWISISWVSNDLWIDCSRTDPDKLGDVALIILNCAFVLYGSSHHSSLQSKANGILTIKLAFITRIFYSFILGTTKIWICAFYLRIFPDRTSRLLSCALFGFIGLYSLLFMIFSIASLIPEELDSPSAVLLQTQFVHSQLQQ